jgi:hypothetical protein
VKKIAHYDVVMPVSLVGVYQVARKRERKLLLNCFDRLARNPFSTSEWLVTDDDGRDNFQIQAGPFLIAYWPDHAVREVRITRLERID